MKLEEERLDKTKYFLTPSREKIYATKGQGHKSLAYKIINEIGLFMIYWKYEECMSSPIFLTCCGYVLVDEGEEKIEFGFGEDDKITKFTDVGYCSAAIDKDYIEYLKKTYDNGKNIIDDVYETEDARYKELIDRIIKELKERQERQNRQKDRDDER